MPRRAAVAAAILLALIGRTSPLQGQAEASPERVLNDVKYLASDALEGRWIGAPGADSAAAYLARRFKEIGLQAPDSGWFQTFTISLTAPAAHEAGLAGAEGRNVIGVLPGKDKALQEEVVIVGAHYDHLGTSGWNVLDSDSARRIHNGADDNASGTAAVLAIAARLKKQRPACTVVVIAFSGEEEGLLGSAWYVKHPLFPLSRTRAMINLDMVGRLRNDRLLIMGTETAKELNGLVDSVNGIAGFDLHKKGDGYGPSDQSSFYAAGIPVLYFFTDLHEDYHRASDDWEKINAQGLARVAEFAAQLTAAVANRTEPLTFVNLPAPVTASKHGEPAPTPGTGAAYLGTVPDMAENPGGVRLSGVRAGSPAEAAGLKPGDIITSIGGMAIPDLESMSEALRQHQPGDTVDIIALRDGAEVRLRAILGKRS
ncbi:MAG TPA: M20/M25/M40 family metallo-hydrolase [Gemmatimonadales bacterium]|nr:M20/M25/M40 family metallo-hydrolase [Gemmatimonadales bacterium]